ncbi:MAG: hypothetical protein BroJett011_04210 [Chloroflexota bacterium]|nr:MAG: hypothetical protein BroJett011_04210 [Chloroflexota bacterium]
MTPTGRATPPPPDDLPTLLARFDAEMAAFFAAARRGQALLAEVRAEVERRDPERSTRK